MAAELHTIEISSRPRNTWTQTVRAALFGIVFSTGILTINGSQFVVLLPLKLLPFSWASNLYDEGIRYTKGSFGTLLILISQWFAPTRLEITFETEGYGRFSKEDIKRLVVRDKAGKVVALDLPRKSVVIANHQVYVDWLYAWCLTYFMHTHRDVFIVLKNSLKWVPFIGWGTQFYRFIFLRRSWANDRKQLSSRLSALGRQSEQQDKPFTLILYPEGTLVSKDTRPISKKYADKVGVENMVHMLLPRSTGLHYSLRSLAPRVPSLKLIDITMVYPGIPPMGYGQSYYTLRSVFFDGVPPPVMHMHLRVFDVSKDVPIGDASLSASNSKVLPDTSSVARTVEVDFPEEEKNKFESWLWELWREKDRLITRFHETGTFTLGGDYKPVEIPLEVRRRRDIFDAFGFLILLVIAYQLWIQLGSG